MKIKKLQRQLERLLGIELGRLLGSQLRRLLGSQLGRLLGSQLGSLLGRLQRGSYFLNDLFLKGQMDLPRVFCVAGCCGGGHVKWCHEVAKPVRVEKFGTPNAKTNFEKYISGHPKCDHPEEEQNPPTL